MSAVRTRLRRLDALRHAHALLRLGLHLLPRGLLLLPASGLPAGPHPALRGSGRTGPLGSAVSDVETGKDPQGLGERQTPEGVRTGSA